jgi:hypothetical protein
VQADAQLARERGGRRRAHLIHGEPCIVEELVDVVVELQPGRVALLGDALEYLGAPGEGRLVERPDALKLELLFERDLRLVVAVPTSLPLPCSRRVLPPGVARRAFVRVDQARERLERRLPYRPARELLELAVRDVVAQLINRLDLEARQRGKECFHARVLGDGGQDGRDPLAQVELDRGDLASRLPLHRRHRVLARGGGGHRRSESNV